MARLPRRPFRRRCEGPRSVYLCATSPATGRHAHRGLLEDRVRTGCCRRAGFAGRGFGRERRREAR